MAKKLSELEIKNVDEYSKIIGEFAEKMSNQPEEYLAVGFSTVDVLGMVYAYAVDPKLMNSIEKEFEDKALQSNIEIVQSILVNCFLRYSL